MSGADRPGGPPAQASRGAAPTGMAGQFMRYGGVGLVATAAHYALLGVLVEVWAVPPWLASGAGAVLGAQVAFVGNRAYTFGHAGDWGPAWWRFMATAALGAVLGMLTVALGVRLGLHYLLAQGAATGLSLVLTFAVNRWWTFHRGAG